MERRKLEIKSNLFGNARRTEKVRKHTNNTVCINPEKFGYEFSSKCLLWEELQGVKVWAVKWGVQNGFELQVEVQTY